MRDSERINGITFVYHYNNLQIKRGRNGRTICNDSKELR